MVDASFVWGAGGSQLTPEQIAQQRKDAAALLTQGTDASPLPTGTRGAGVWTQGLARVAKALYGGYESGQADQASKANDADNKTMIAALLGGGAPAAAAPAAPVAAVAAPGSSASLDPETTGYIKNAADKFGVDPAYLQRTALIESGGKADATNPSGAAGLFQFMPRTAKEYGLDNPLDPEDSAMAAAELAADNRKTLADTLGRNPTNAELYLAHQQGADGAAKLLANPNVPAVQAVGRDAVLQNGGSENMTAGQFASKWLSKFGGDAAPAAAPVQTAQAGGVPPAISQAVARVTGAMPAVPAPAAVARVAGAMPSDDATALPAGATPTQGYAVPGQPAAVPAAPAVPAAVAKVAGGLSNVNPAVLQAMTSPYANASTKQIAGLLLQQQLTPKDVHTQETDKDGNVWDVNKLTGQRTVALKSESDPKWGIVGKDQYGQPTYGYAPTREEYAAKQKAAAAAPAPDQVDLTNVHGKDYMDTLVKQDPKYASQVQSILEGRAPYPTGMLLKTPYGQKLASDVTQADPTFEAGNASARVKVRNEFEAGGVSSPAGQITAGNTAIQHAGEMSDALERLKADSGVLSSVGNADIPYVSKWANELHNSSVQGTAAGAPLNDFMTAKNHFSEEVTKFYAGSAGSEAERTRALANLDAAKSLPELRSAIKTEANLMQGKVNALQDRWRKGMGPLVGDFPLVQPKSQEAIDRIMQRDAGTAPAAPAAAPAAASSVPAPAVAKLAQNPTSEMKAHFDEVFGAGAAERALAGGK